MSREASSNKSSRTKASRTKAKPKSKPEGFLGLVETLNKWTPSNVEFTRAILTEEVRRLLESESYVIINSCVPALIVDSKYPIELMRFRTKDDIDEFVTRMVWMHEVFKSSIGILVGITDEKTATLVTDVCSALLKMDEECVVILV